MVHVILLGLAVTDFAQRPFFRPRSPADIIRARKPFPFLRLPAEIRNMVYNDLWPYGRPYRNIRYLPAITRVNTQLRAEALPVYLSKGVVLRFEPYDAEKWGQCMDAIIRARAIAFAAMSSSTLRHTTSLELWFEVWEQPGLKIRVEMSNDPKNMSPPRPADGEGGESVVIGTPDLDWTNAQAVRAACNKAARQLRKEWREKKDELVQKNRRRQEEDGWPLHVGYVPGSTLAHQRTAIDAICRLAKAYPHLARAVRIMDCSYYTLESGWSRTHVLT